MKDLQKVISQSNLESLVTALNDFVFVVDRDGVFLSAWTDKSSKFFVPKFKFIGLTITQVLPVPLASKLLASIEKVLETGQSLDEEYESPFAPDEYYLARIQILPESNNLIGVSVRDISSIKVTQLQLKENEERFRMLIQTSSDVITVLNREGQVVFDSFSMQTSFGYETPLTGNNIFEYIHPDDVVFAIAKFKEFQQTPGISDPIEFRFKAGDGSWKYVESIGNNLFDNPAISGYVINSRDITQRKQMQGVINTSNYKLEGILESTNDNIFAVDYRYRYTSFNRAHKETIKWMYNRDIQIGDVSLVLDNDIAIRDRAEMQKFYDRCLSGERFSVIYEVNNPKMPLGYSEMNFNPIKDEQQKIIGVAVFSKDITEKVKDERELIKAKNDAIDAVKAKSEFLSNMSHEIRTPINAIMGLTELLMEKNHEKEVVEYLKSIKYSTDNLLSVINDILDFSKIEAGKVSLESIDFNIYDSIKSIANIFLLKAQSKEIDFTTDVDVLLPKFIKGDPYRLNQILVNLIGNALKFTQKGSVKLSVKMVELSSEIITVEFRVTDTGIGIADDKKDLIFESFIQGYTDVTRKFGGSGLGLAITQKLTLLQGGTIKMQSELNRGSEFVVQIPYSISEITKTPVPEIVKESTKSLSGKHLLIVEDNSMNQFVMRHIMSLWKANYDVAENGLEAIALLKQHTYHLVLMDLQMPEMSGYDATNYIRSKYTDVLNPSVPIIALTADAFVETKKKVLESGMNDFITKPFNQEELYQKIIKHII